MWSEWIVVASVAAGLSLGVWGAHFFARPPQAEALDAPRILSGPPYPAAFAGIVRSVDVERRSVAISVASKYDPDRDAVFVLTFDPASVTMQLGAVATSSTDMEAAVAHQLRPGTLVTFTVANDPQGGPLRAVTINIEPPQR